MFVRASVCLSTLCNLRCWNQLLGSSVIQGLQLLGLIVAQQ